ncbi:MAG: hypothetical protein OK439_07055, partial [Thaumarchaeota archaeon]|nr:hypothetical protein [Nitrososphaerota archaeon]
MKTRRLIEGSTELVVPESIEPSKYPSFFNPEGKFVRDVSLVCYKIFASTMVGKGNDGDLSFSDCLSGTGARGIRVANEALEFRKIFLNDISSVSIELAQRSAQLNHVEEKCYFSNEETCGFLATRLGNQGERFDVV